jgi:hypothetical protein
MVVNSPTTAMTLATNHVSRDITTAAISNWASVAAPVAALHFISGNAFLIRAIIK